MCTGFGDHMTTSRSQFSPSTILVQGIKTQVIKLNSKFLYPLNKPSC